MEIGVLGTGVVGKRIAARLAELGHDVVMGTRDVSATLGRSEPDRYGDPPFRQWLQQNPQLRLGTFSDAAGHGEMLFNCTSGANSLEALGQAGAANLEGKVLVDISNPLDFSRGMPPSLTVCNTDSLAEQIQRAFPNTRVVKTLNTTNANVMVYPQRVAQGDHTIFVSGNDPAAKTQVVEVLRSFGWKDIIDLGDLRTARGAEMVLPLWVSIMGQLGNPMFNFKVAR